MRYSSYRNHKEQSKLIRRIKQNLYKNMLKDVLKGVNPDKIGIKNQFRIKRNYRKVDKCYRFIPQIQKKYLFFISIWKDIAVDKSFWNERDALKQIKTYIADKAALKKIIKLKYIEVSPEDIINA